MIPRLSRPEWVLLVSCAVLVVVALVAPGIQQPAGYHSFVDRRAEWGIPNALNVLSNLPFAIGGVWGLLALRRGAQRAPGRPLLPVERTMALMFFAGLMLTSLCSSWYHWLPNNAGLALDRLGMAVAFAGLLGLAAADRIGERAGQAVGWAVLVLGPAAVGVSAVTGNVLPWALVQFGGVAVVVVLMFFKPVPGALGVSIGWTIALYGLAKVAELFDAQIYALTEGVLSGHSLKHLVASLAAWPVLVAVLRARQAGRGMG